MNVFNNSIWCSNINNLESYMYMHFRSNHCQVNAYQLPEIGWQQIQKVPTINWACVSTYDRQNLRKNCAQDIHCTFKHTSPRSDIVVILNTYIRVIMYVNVFSVYIIVLHEFQIFSQCYTNIPMNMMESMDEIAQWRSYINIQHFTAILLI